MKDSLSLIGLAKLKTREMLFIKFSCGAAYINDFLTKWHDYYLVLFSVSFLLALLYYFSAADNL
jgi:hypothetical protein